MDLSVIIPTHQRPAKLTALLASLLDQSLPADRYEILVGIDGHDTGETHALAKLLPPSSPNHAPHISLNAFPKQNQANVRNKLLPAARAPLTLFLNDDVTADRDLLAQHIRAHKQSSQPALILGPSPWKIPTPDRLFDRLLRETSMIFFYDQMPPPHAPYNAMQPGSPIAHDPARDWGFRHAWTLNLSAPTDLINRAGGFTVFPSTYIYDDDEFAYRVATKLGAPVLYQPTAVVTHDHHYEPPDYLRREYSRGYTAWHVAKAAPAFSAALYNQDITAQPYLDYCAQSIEHEAKQCARLEQSFLDLANIPASAIPPITQPLGRQLITLIYQQHIPLKRHHWRKGLLDAASNKSPTSPFSKN